MLNTIKQFFAIGTTEPEPESLWRNILLFVIVATVAFVANVITKKVILNIVVRVAKASKTIWDDILLEYHFFRRVSHVVPAVILYGSAPFVFTAFPVAVMIIQKASIIYFVFVGMLVVDAFLNSGLAIYKTFNVRTRKVPIRSVIQMLKIVIYFFGGVIILATILNKSPMYFIGGMGAIAAVLMLVFKDAILGLVAGIQLASNQMVQVGDWVEMPSHGADGEVIDISLTTVKIQNWDKTITAVPAYAMVSESFINWRGMEESSGRRIKRSIHIDINSIVFCTDDMLVRFKKYECLKDVLPNKIAEIDEHNTTHKLDISERVNGRRLTNIGIFRIYLTEYLVSHPEIENDLTHMVRQLQSTEYGVPVQVYAFCKNKDWVPYEMIQSDIFDHIFAVAKEFDLKVFQRPKD